MNQFEELREKCAKIANQFVGTDQIVDAIRALPLPEDQTEALQKTLDALSKRCYIMSESHQINDMCGARLIIGFNDILDAGDAHQAIVTIKKRGSMTSFNKLIETDSKYKIDLPRAVIQPSKAELKTEIETLRKENEQLKALLQKHGINEFIKNNLMLGEVYAGLVLGKEGEKDYHLFLRPEKPETELSWYEAMKWAQSIGYELPSLQEQSLLFANCQSEFEKEWHWSCEQDAHNDVCAWVQYFDTGSQYYYRKSDTVRARAVRRLLIIE